MYIYVYIERVRVEIDPKSNVEFYPKKNPKHLLPVYPFSLIVHVDFFLFFEDL